MLYMLLTLGVLWVGFQIWRRTEQHDQEIRELRDRVKRLERRPAPTSANEATESKPVAHPPVPVAASRPIAPEMKAPAPQPQLAVIPPAAREQVPAAAMNAETIETAIGSRWLLYVGVIAVIVGVSYFEKLAIDNQWVGEGARVLQGGAAGLLLMYAGLRFIRSGFPVYGQMIAGGGIAVQYVSIYAAFNFYHLIERNPAFALLCAVTGLAATFADRQRSQGLALIAVGGGFATPFLLPSDVDAQLALFGYDAILIAGTMYLARRREWPILNLVSYGLTVLTVFGWAARFYAPSKYLVTELFLTLFCAMYLYILRESRKPKREEANLSNLLWTAPIAYYLASVAILASHPAAMLLYLLGLGLAGAFASARSIGHGNAIVRLVFLIATTGPLLRWSDRYAGDTWLVPGWPPSPPFT